MRLKRTVPEKPPRVTAASAGHVSVCKSGSVPQRPPGTATTPLPRPPAPASASPHSSPVKSCRLSHGRALPPRSARHVPLMERALLPPPPTALRTQDQHNRGGGDGSADPRAPVQPLPPQSLTAAGLHERRAQRVPSDALPAPR